MRHKAVTLVYLDARRKPTGTHVDVDTVEFARELLVRNKLTSVGYAGECDFSEAVSLLTHPTRGKFQYASGF